MEYEITDIAEYLSVIQERTEQKTQAGTDEDLIFRGQIVDHPLVPKILRLTPKANFIHTEKALFREFKRANPMLIDSFVVDDWDYLTLGQHFGLPTRLLDWSTNALTALWFATNLEPLRNQDSANAIVWILSVKESNFVCEGEMHNPFEIPEIKIFRPRIIKQRINNQLGVFSIHSNDALEKNISINDSSIYAPNLIKIKIPCDRIKPIQNDLNTLGVNAFSIFPELEGLCAYLQWKFFK